MLKGNQGNDLTAAAQHQRQGAVTAHEAAGAIEANGCSAQKNVVTAQEIPDIPDAGLFSA
jgi:hypothetical protein